MGQVRPVTSLVLVVLFVLVIINVAPVSADTFNPNPPVAGQAFTISGAMTAPVGAWEVSSACGIGAGTIYQSGIDTGIGPFTDSISALPAGTYYFSHEFDSADCSSTGGFTVIQAITTTTVNCSPPTIVVGGPSSSCMATVSAAAGSISGEEVTWVQSGGTGSVTFPSGSTCTLSGTSCSVNVNGASVGNPTIQASYPGDSNNAPSSGTQSLSVNPPPSVSLSANPSSIIVTAGSSGMTTVTVNLIGFPSIGNPMVTCTGLPTGATCSTNPNPLPSFLHNGDQFTLTVAASSSTTPGTYQVTVQLTFLQPTMIRPIFFATSPIMFGSSSGIGPSAVSTQATSNPLTITVVVNAPTPVPEYPVRLPILAAFMIIAYGLIRRKTKTLKNI